MRSAPNPSQSTETIFLEQETANAKLTASLNLQSALEPAPGAVDQPMLENSHWQAPVRAGRELTGHSGLNQLFKLVLDLSLNTVKASRGVLMGAPHQT